MEFTIRYDEEKLREIVGEVIEKIKSGELQLIEGPKGEWIPISQQEPTMEGLYLVTFDNGKLALFYFDEYAHSNPDFKTVTAWMPAPKPYKDPFDHLDEPIACKAKKCSPDGCKHCDGYEPIGGA